MAFLEFFGILSSHPSIGLIVAAILTLSVYNTHQTRQNTKELRKISQSLFGAAEERELNGEGIYQKVEKLDERVDE